MKLKLLLKVFIAAVVFFIICVYIFIKSREISYSDLKIELNSKSSLFVGDLGVPLIESESLLDMITLQGLITSRDRFFQMDLMRKRMQGRLTEYFGEKALVSDAHFRNFNFKKYVTNALELMSAENKKVLLAYSAGVNAYLAKDILPVEYYMLKVKPESWSAEDTLYVALGMFYDLDFSGQYPAEYLNSALGQKRTPIVQKFLTPAFGKWSVPYEQEDLQMSLTIPGPDELDVRNENYQFDNLTPFYDNQIVSASNGFAVSPFKTIGNSPLLAGDPHLGLMAPNIWYRVQMRTKNLQLTGVSLPGVPGLAIGTNEYFAWTFTAGYSDNLDLILAGKAERFLARAEHFQIKNGSKKRFTFWDSKEGPVIENENGISYILKWTALNSKMLSELSFLPLNKSTNLEEFEIAASSWRGPCQNLIFASKMGDIGHYLVGLIPTRKNFNGQTATVWSDSQKWQGFKSWSEMPKIINPKSGYVFSGNNRWVKLRKDLNYQSDGFGFNYPVPTRGYDLNSVLKKSEKIKAGDLYRLQLSTKAHLYIWYQQIILNHSLDKSEWGKAIFKVVSEWNHHAHRDEKGYALLKQFRRELINNVLGPVWGLNSLRDPLGRTIHFVKNWNNHEQVLQLILEKKPKHLLHNKFKTFDDAIADAVFKSAKKLAKTPAELVKQRWGDVHKSNIAHPFAAVLPWPLKNLFSFPKIEVDGDAGVVQANFIGKSRFHGVSMRFVFDFSDKNNGVFNQPGGQSGHVFSKNFFNQLENWGNGTPTDFYPKSLKKQFSHPL